MRKTLLKATLAGLLLGAVSGLPALAQTQFYPGIVKAEAYRGFGGVTVADLTNNAAYPDNPSDVTFVKFVEYPAGGDDGSPPPGNVYADYGVRISGFFIPPDDANYVFYLSSDDAGAFFLSTDDSPANLQEIATEPTWNPVRGYYGIDRRPGCDFSGSYLCENISDPIPLQGGERYYFEALMKEQGGGDNLSVAFAKEFEVIEDSGFLDANFQPIPLPIKSQYIGVMADSNVAITQDPQNTFGPMFGTATFSVAHNAVPGVTYQWKRDGTDIPGATGATYSTPTLDETFDGAEYSVVVTGPNNSVESEAGVLTIIPVDFFEGVARAEIYSGFAGTAISALTGHASYPDNPTSREEVSFLEYPPGGADGSPPPGNVMANYGVRISGFITPTNSGSYVFYIAADDNAQFWLSTDSNPANLQLIASEPQWNGVRNFTGQDRRPGCLEVPANCENISDPIPLVDGQRYYFEALMKEEGGGDNLAVAWTLEGGTIETGPGGTPLPIKGEFLSYSLPQLIAIGGIESVAHGLNTFRFTVTDAGASVLDPDTVVLRIDGEDAAVTFTKTDDITSFLHTRPTRYEPGTSHSYEIEATDVIGNTVRTQGNFNIPSPLLPAEDLPGPAVVDGQWAVRWIFNAGTVGSLAAALNLIQTADDPGFTGTVVDTTHSVINFPAAGGFIGGGIDYPLEVTGATGWTGDNFVQLGIAHIKITEEGDYTFGTRTDDGFALRIRGGTAISESGNGQLDFADPEVVAHPGTTGNSNTRGVYHLRPGVYRIEFFWYEAGGGDNGELFVAPGAFANEGDTTEWYLVGDFVAGGEFTKLGVDENGWTIISSDPNLGDTNVLGSQLDQYAYALGALDATGGNPMEYDVLNVGDPETSGGVLPFPKNTPNADDDFALKATAKLVVPEAGLYALGFNSDDGASLRIVDQPVVEIIENLTGFSYINFPAGTVGDQILCDCLTGNSGTVGTWNLAAGTYDIEVIMFERGGGAYIQARGAEASSPVLPLLERNGTGTFMVAPRIELTDEAPSVEPPNDITITSAAVSGGNITVEWTGGGTLFSAPSVDGPWTTTGDSDGSFSEAATGSGKFYQVQQ